MFIRSSFVPKSYKVSGALADPYHVRRADVERLQHLLAQQDKDIDETTKQLKELKDNRERISRELSEAKCVHVCCDNVLLLHVVL